MKRLDLQRFAEPELPDNTITPELNYETEAFINVAEPSSPTATWASLAALTTNMSQSLNERCIRQPIMQIKAGEVQRLLEHN